MKKALLVALMGLMTIITANAAVDFQNITITLKNGQVIKYDASQLDHVTYVGGEFGEEGAVGIKLYITATTSEDYLYSQIISIVKGNQETTVAAPTFSPTGGTYSVAQTVTITTTTSGATIYYTTDGTIPTSSSTRYTAAITVSTTTTIKAIAVKDGVSSAVATATFTINSGSTTDNNVNRNALSSKYDKDKYMWSLEWPRINETDNNTWVVKSTSEYGVTFSLEWSNSLIANRWTCYTMHNGNNSNTVSRKDAFAEDPELPPSTRSTLNDYSNSGYSRGHLCPSADRLCSREQNSQTFYLSNMQPQWQSHNGGIWLRLENKIRNWDEICDTLYVVKAATITDVTLNNSPSAGIYTQKCNNRLPVPKYFYMAVLARTGNTYKAVGFWTEHTDDAQTSTSLASCAITIDELERRTGIDFFCNLPDDIEDAVEAIYDSSFWNP